MRRKTPSGRSSRPGLRRPKTVPISEEEVAIANTPPIQQSPDSWVIVYTARAHEFTRRHLFEAVHQSYLVGRGSQCHIMIDSQAASRQHARIEFRTDGWWVVDLDSMNGTWVNDVRVKAKRLAHNDRIQIGGVIFKHLAGSETESAYVDALRVAMVTDGLTQCLNDRAFKDELKSMLLRDEPKGLGTGLLLVDIDHFKRVNDQQGHPAGDRVLREMALLLRRSVAFAKTGRLGGEEFGLLLPTVSMSQLQDTAESVRRVVEDHSFALEKGVLKLTVSVGGALARGGEHRDDYEAFFERVDKLMYTAKNSGRNRVCLET